MTAIHPAPVQFSSDQLAIDPILHFFHYAHLPAALQASSRPFCELAGLIINNLPRNAERTVALRKLLEAKDAAGRANVGAAGVASGGTWLDRVRVEHAELTVRMKALAQFFADGYPGVESTEDHAQLNEQYLAMENYRAILAARIENAEHKARPGAVRSPPMEGLEDGSAIRETGGHDQDRDGPIKFGD